MALAATSAGLLHPAPVRTLAVLAPVHPLTGGAPQFNAAMVNAMRELGAVELISWKRLYPPFLHRGTARDDTSRPPRVPAGKAVLDYADPRSWRAALRLVDAAGAHALVLPWLHPVMAPPYRYLLRHAPPGVVRVLVCHNVRPHERMRGGDLLSRAALRHADLFVTHAPQQRRELSVLGLAGTPVLEAFLPRLTAADLAAPPSVAAVAAERVRQGRPDLSLLSYGAVRPYKGIDLALEALALVDRGLRVRLTVAGAFWDGGKELRREALRLGIADRVELRDGYVSNDETALLFEACDAALLPYRSASQSGVVQLSFAYGRPVIATAVGGLPAAVADERDGLLCEPGSAASLARAIERMAVEKDRFAAGVRAAAPECSYRRYAELLHGALAEVGR